MISIIAAMSKNGVIGNNNSLIWKLPADMKRFKYLTTGNTIIMGRKTYESIGRSLPNRRNIIITSNLTYQADRCEICSSLESALELCKESNIFIIGGGQIYKQSLSIADNINLTIIDEYFDGDTYFPDIGKEWVKISKNDYLPDDQNKYRYSFIDYEKYKF